MALPWILTAALVVLAVALLLRLMRTAPQPAPSKDILAAIVENIDAAIVVVEERKIVATNATFRRTVGLSRDAVATGRTLEELFRGQDVPTSALQPLMDSDLSVVASDGTSRILHKSPARPLDVGGRRVELTTFEDVTAQRVGAERNEHRDRLAAIGTLAAIAMHEIRNPLSSVQMNVQSAMESVVDVGAETGSSSGALADLFETLAQCREDAQRIEMLAKDYGTFSSPQSDVLAPMDLTNCARVTIRMLGAYLRNSVHLETDLQEVPLVVAGDVRVRQMLINLLTNAVQALEARKEPGRITIRTRTENGDAVVEVEDDGPGIPAEIQQRIFDPMFTTKERGMGTGLGLYVVRQLAEELDVRVVVDSTPGVGSRFSLVFSRVVPRSRSGALVLKPEATESPMGRILLVDVDLSVTNALRRDAPDCELTFARTPNEGMSLLRRKRFDLVLLDATMPHRQLQEVLTLLDDRYDDLPNRVVLMAPFGKEDTVRPMAKQAGISLVTKPFNSGMMVSKMLARVARD